MAGFAVDTVFQNPPTNVECRKAVANSMEKTGEGTVELQNHPAISCYCLWFWASLSCSLRFCDSCSCCSCLSCLGPPQNHCGGKRPAHETTSFSRYTDDIRKLCQERRVCQVSGFRAVDKIGLQDSEMPGASRINRKWQHQTKMPRARNVADKRSRCRRPCQPGGQGPFL